MGEAQKEEGKLMAAASQGAMQRLVWHTGWSWKLLLGVWILSLGTQNDAEGLEAEKCFYKVYLG